MITFGNVQFSTLGAPNITITYSLERQEEGNRFNSNYIEASLQIATWTDSIEIKCKQLGRKKVQLTFSF